MMSESTKKSHGDFNKDENLLTAATANPVESDLKDSEASKRHASSCSESEATSFVEKAASNILSTESCAESFVEISKVLKDECLQGQEEKNISTLISPEESLTGLDSNLPQNLPHSTYLIVDEKDSIPVSISLKEQTLIELQSESKHFPFTSENLSEKYSSSTSYIQEEQLSLDSELALSSQEKGYALEITDKEISGFSSDAKDEQVSLTQSEALSSGLKIQSSHLPSCPLQTGDEPSIDLSVHTKYSTELGDITDEDCSDSMAISVDRQSSTELEPELIHSTSVTPGVLDEEYFNSSSAVQEKQTSRDTELSTLSQTEEPVLKTSIEKISCSYSDVKKEKPIYLQSNDSETSDEESIIPSSIQSKHVSSSIKLQYFHTSTVLSQSADEECSIISAAYSKPLDAKFKEISLSTSAVNPLEIASKCYDLPMSSEQSKIKLDETSSIPICSENNSKNDSSIPTMPAEQPLTEHEKEVSPTVPSNLSEIESSIPSIELPKLLPTESEISTSVVSTSTSEISENDCTSSLPEALRDPPRTSTAFVLINDSKVSSSNKTEDAVMRLLKHVAKIKILLKELKEMESLLNKGFRNSKIMALSFNNKKYSGFTTMQLYAQEARLIASQLFVQIQKLSSWFQFYENIDERIKVYKSDIENFYRTASDMLIRFNRSIYC